MDTSQQPHHANKQWPGLEEFYLQNFKTTLDVPKIISLTVQFNLTLMCTIPEF